MHDEYKGLGHRFGHQIKVHTQMPARFSKSIGEPDAIVLFTNTVSHKMVKTAVQEAKKKRIPIVRSHTSSKSSLKDILEKIEKLAVK